MVNLASLLSKFLIFFSIFEVFLLSGDFSKLVEYCWQNFVQ